MMADGEYRPVAVSRRIGAPARDIFRVLADPAAHPLIDGSGMLREGESAPVITGTGDAFAMQMYLPQVGSYLMLNWVVEFEADRRIGWEPTPGDAAAAAMAELPIGTSQGYRWRYELVPAGPGATVVTETFDCSGASAGIRAAVHDGADWIDSMTTTLERLEEICSAASDWRIGSARS
jgi:hypothetical protein